ncbi:MFS transporter [Brevibacterium casei]|uniref:MFS transporter n=1 Tax=Brevibacterium casei TaxID=33889 RepID=UPI003F80DF41
MVDINVHAVRQRGGVIALAGTIMTMVAASAPSLFYPRIAERLALAPVASTLVFAVYAFTFLGALLCFGALSDFIGRRPVVSSGAVLLGGSMLLFWSAEALPELVIARALQGAASGALVPALAAMLVDCEPPNRPGSATLWNSVGPLLGFAVGTLGASVALDVAARPADTVFGAVSGGFLVLAGLVWATPETVVRSGVGMRDLLPKFGMPRRLRPILAASAPALIASWATHGLFLALGARLVREVFDGETNTSAGLVFGTVAAAGIIASRVIRRYSPRTISIFATSALALGTAVGMSALALHSYPVYLAAAAAIGAGFGTSFLGVLSTLQPATEPSERAAALAIVYVIAYLSFGVPTIIAGLLVPTLSLAGTMMTLGAVNLVLAVLATILRTRIREPKSSRAL